MSGDDLPVLDGSEQCPFCNGKGHMDDEQADTCPVCGGEGCKGDPAFDEDDAL